MCESTATAGLMAARLSYAAGGQDLTAPSLDSCLRMACSTCIGSCFEAMCSQVFGAAQFRWRESGAEGSTGNAEPFHVHRGKVRHSKPARVLPAMHGAGCVEHDALFVISAGSYWLSSREAGAATSPATMRRHIGT